MMTCLNCPSRSACERHGCRKMNAGARRKIEEEENHFDRMIEQVCDDIADVFGR